ncbi:hypothetical protein YC2023_001384 [Brassica napus]
MSQPFWCANVDIREEKKRRYKRHARSSILRTIDIIKFTSTVQSDFNYSEMLKNDLFGNAKDLSGSDDTLRWK